MSVPRLAIMDDIASHRAVYLCGFITALFAVGFSLALLAGRPNAQRIAVPISTATITAIPDRGPDVPPAVSATEITLPAGKQSADTIGDLTDKKRPGTSALEGELETPFRPAGEATPPSTDITSVDSKEPALGAIPAHTQASTKQHRAKTSSAQKLYSPDKYHQVPRGAEKMFDANWQPKAFAYQ